MQQVTSIFHWIVDNIWVPKSDIFCCKELSIIASRKPCWIAAAYCTFFDTFPFRFRTGIFLAVDWFSIVCWSYYVFHIHWQFSDVPLNQVWPICWGSWVFGCFHGGNVGYTTILPKLSEQVYPWHEVSNNMHTVSKLQKFTFNLQIAPFLQILRENNVHNVDCH